MNKGYNESLPNFENYVCVVNE